MCKELHKLGGIPSRYRANELVYPLGCGGQDEVLDLLCTGSLGERLQDQPCDWLSVVGKVVHQLVYLEGVRGGLQLEYLICI